MKEILDTNDPDGDGTFETSIGYRMPTGKYNKISTIYNDKNHIKVYLKTFQLFINYNFNKY